MSGLVPFRSARLRNFFVFPVSSFVVAVAWLIFLRGFSRAPFLVFHGRYTVAYIVLPYFRGRVAALVRAGTRVATGLCHVRVAFPV